MPKTNFCKGFISPLIFVFLIIIAVIGLIFYFTVIKKEKVELISRSQTPISGVIDFNGVVPNGGTIAIAKKGLSDNNFVVVINNLPVSDMEEWKWDQAKKGEHYQMQAYLEVDGQYVAFSEVQEVSAPASNVTLRINSLSSINQQTPATISGIVDLNGYAPVYSTINILARKVGDTNFTTIASNLDSADGVTWQWGNAITGTNYEVMAQLVQSNQVLSASNTLIVTAPAVNEVLRINSTVTPPFAPQSSTTTQSSTPQPPIQTTPSTGSISGTIYVNGVVPNNSNVIIVARPTGTVPFNVVVSGLSPQSSINWSWNGASVGQSYDLQAVLTVNGNDYLITPTLTVVAPAANENFTLNVSTNLIPPGSGPQVSCGTQNSGLYSANITFSYVSSAAQYWIRVGDPGGVDNKYFDSQITAQNQSGQTQQTVTTGYSFSPNVNYAVKYAYSLNTGNTSLGSFSPWSAITTFKCP